MFLSGCVVGGQWVRTRESRVRAINHTYARVISVDCCPQVWFIRTENVVWLPVVGPVWGRQLPQGDLAGGDAGAGALFLVGERLGGGDRGGEFLTKCGQGLAQLVGLGATR